MKKIIITLGCPNGISPEITIKALNALDLPQDNVIIAGNKNIQDYYGSRFGLKLKKNYDIIEIPFDINALKIGSETKEAGKFSFQALKCACETVKENKADAIVTAPVSKNELKLAGYNYSGQTEILEHFLGGGHDKAEMVFVCGKFSVMLITRHTALSNVSKFIKKELLIERIKRLKQSFERQLNIKNPRFALCALNPHAGEQGMFGMEETEEIIPAAEILRAEGINITNPMPADSLFTDLRNPKYDCYIAMYHDQGLIPVKLSAPECVNASLGLNVLRTSPAHGTAYDIAGKMKANPDSMINALLLALKSIG